MKNRKVSSLAIIIAISMLAVGGLWAQPVPGDFQSPSSYSTFGRYRSAADDFIRPDSYTSAKVENWFAMTSFDNDYATGTTNTYKVNVGYAKKLDSLYLGLYYGGAFWEGVSNRTYTESRQNWHGKAKDGVKEYTTLPAPAANPNGNRISVLVGLADMGFRLSFFSSLNTFKDSDFLVGTTEYKEYQSAVGMLSPQLALGMAKNLTDNGLKPWLTADFDFNRNYARSTVYGGVPDYKAGDERIARSQNNLYTRIEAGLGGYTFLKKNGFSYSADLDYRGRFYSYNNEYEYATDATNTKYKTETYKGNFNGTGFAEPRSSNHRIRPSVSGSWSGENLGLKFKLNLPVEISSTGNKPLALETQADLTTSKYNGKLVQNGSETSTTVLGFPPSLQLAAQWKVTPKLTLNAGGEIALGALSKTTTESGKNYVNGKEAPAPNSTSTSVTTAHGVTTNALRLGVALAPTENLTFEAACGIDTNNSINVFETGAGTGDGLFHFANILVSLKF